MTATMSFNSLPMTAVPRTTEGANSYHLLSKVNEAWTTCGLFTLLQMASNDTSGRQMMCSRLNLLC